MKKLLFLTLLSSALFGCKEKGVSYNDLINKHLNNKGVQQILSELGSDYEYQNFYGSQTFSYDSQGIKVGFSKHDTLKSVSFHNGKVSPEVVLPYRLSMNLTKGEVEDILGKPDKIDRNATYYVKENISFVYNSEDHKNPNNRIQIVFIQDLSHYK